ncbi:MBL fold metallo-hydrolase [Skermania sp. ID1734]|uniref:MBL fold metallo-hydrolase n=1 Tax=Skermania sp. ID1734 TaxID=2597516 RepID=UPI00117FA3E1|nr:MBL fold metallo-hydrolase [Skermania sp. ID1734]TSD98036.1 MBL fold metallo-hydrolase [Skermania sp. ID1734]
MESHSVPIDTTYTGHVSAGSAAQQRDVPGATIIKMSVGPMDNNAYLLRCSETGLCLLIDAANDADRLIWLLEQEAPALELIITTHQHADHWQALQEVAATTRAATAAHPLDAQPLPVKPDRLLNDGDTVHVGEMALDVIHLQGHTPGSIALVLTDRDGQVHIFTGDCLFPGGVGKTTNPTDFASLLGGVESKLFNRYADAHIYPGHGDDTMLADERPKLTEWRERGW